MPYSCLGRLIGSPLYLVRDELFSRKTSMIIIIMMMMMIIIIIKDLNRASILLFKGALQNFKINYKKLF